MHYYKIDRHALRQLWQASGVSQVVLLTTALGNDHSRSSWFVAGSPTRVYKSEDKVRALAALLDVPLARIAEGPYRRVKALAQRGGTRFVLACEPQPKPKPKPKHKPKPKPKSKPKPKPKPTAGVQKALQGLYAVIDQLESISSDAATSYRELVAIMSPDKALTHGEATTRLRQIVHDAQKYKQAKDIFS